MQSEFSHQPTGGKSEDVPPILMPDFSTPRHKITALEQAEIRKELSPLESRGALVDEVLDALKMGCRVTDLSDKKTGLHSFEIFNGEDLFTVAQLRNDRLEISSLFDYHEKQEAPARQEIELFEKNRLTGYYNSKESKDQPR